MVVLGVELVGGSDGSDEEDEDEGSRHEASPSPTVI